MTEINELVAPPQPHSPGDDVECPFCPAPKPEDFTTYPGARNKSSVLEDVMIDPGCLVSKQSGARPKDGNEHRQRPSGAKPKPDPIFHHDLRGPPGHWKYFISRVALNFHRTVCEHKPR